MKSLFDEIVEWRMRVGSYFVSVTINAGGEPCIVITDVMRGELPDDARREILEELFTLAGRLKRDVAERLSSTTLS